MIANKNNDLRKRCKRIVACSVFFAFIVSACGADVKTKDEIQVSSYDYMASINDKELNIIEDNYRTAYEIFVYSFYDSDGDGIGDINGITKKLDYLNDGNNSTDTDLGINEIYLMPVMPSDTYHKYDVNDYYNIDPSYGTMEGFENLISEAHNRGINVIIDFVMNHTSDTNQWFLEASDYLKALGDKEVDLQECPYVDYYNFTKNNPGSGYEKLEGTDWYYECRFWGEMPDLNLQSEQVRGELEDIASFWLDKGVDGFRLDATSYFVSNDKEANIEILTWFNNYVKSVKEDAYIVGEAWTDENEYMDMYESGIDSFFNFAMGNKDGVISKVASGKSKSSAYSSHIEEISSTFNESNSLGKSPIDAPFLSNHDTGRAAGYFAGDESEESLKLAWGLNLLEGGTAFIYYGEEIGMKGSGKDENKRVGMYWSDGDYEGKCEGPIDADEVKMKYPSLEEQKSDVSSIYSYIKQAIKLRNIYPEIARGVNKEVTEFEEDNICAFTKEYNGECMLIIVNTSDESNTINIEGKKVYDKNISDMKFAGVLLTGEEVPSVDEKELIVPAKGIVMLK